MGLLGLDPASFYSYTIEELSIAAEKKAELIEQAERSEWERVRWQTTLLLQPSLKKGAKLKPKDLITFPWEKKKTKKLSAEELFQQIQERDLL